MFTKNNVYVIFGATGDLALTKLFPALYTILNEGLYPNDLDIIAVGRRHLSDDEYKELIVNQLKDSHTKILNEKSLDILLRKIHYLKMNFTEENDYEILNGKVKELSNNKSDLNILYYLATAPQYFSVITTYIKNILDFNYIRQSLLIEKPFGRDYDSACKLNKEITASFKEEEIYRIDHYLGKEMIRNIIFLRFSNQIFESVWNKDSIDNVQITVAENRGINERGNYFENSGTFRDMVQNHILQIVALIAMNKPKSLNTKDIQDEKVKILNSLCQFKENDFNENLVLGQYSKNDMKGYNGYREESNVNPQSLIETFVGLKLGIDNPTWKGVPFFVKTGKRLANHEAYITIQLKKPSGNQLYDKQFTPNLIQIQIQPEEGVNFTFNVKESSSDYSAKTITASYCHNCDIDYKSVEAYEKILIDSIEGDKSIFTNWKDLKTSWEFIDSFTNLDDAFKESKLESYLAGSNGPDSFSQLLERNGIIWWENKK